MNKIVTISRQYASGGGVKLQKNWQKNTGFHFMIEHL